MFMKQEISSRLIIECRRNEPPIDVRWHLKYAWLKSSSLDTKTLTRSNLPQPLATEGIQRGHVSLHDKNLAVQARAKGDLIDIIAAKIAAG